MKHSPKMYSRIANAFVLANGRDFKEHDVVWEHGQFWVIATDLAEDEEHVFSVEEATGPGTIDGFYFEAL